MKTLAIRLEEDQHAQLGMIAQLEELTVTDAIRQAIEQWIEARRSNPQLQARAEAVLADIDRDAATRRDAIATLLGTPAPASAAAKRRGGTGGSKGPQAALGKEEPTNTGYL
jgi:ferric-dicitrate binding protein FerR (iron transport regulator)